LVVNREWRPTGKPEPTAGEFGPGTVLMRCPDCGSVVMLRPRGSEEAPQRTRCKTAAAAASVPAPLAPRLVESS